MEADEALLETMQDGLPMPEFSDDDRGTTGSFAIPLPSGASKQPNLTGGNGPAAHEQYPELAASMPALQSEVRPAATPSLVSGAAPATHAAAAGVPMPLKVPHACAPSLASPSQQARLSVRQSATHSLVPPMPPEHKRAHVVGPHASKASAVMSSCSVVSNFTHACAMPHVCVVMCTHKCNLLSVGAVMVDYMTTGRSKDLLKCLA